MPARHNVYLCMDYEGLCMVHLTLVRGGVHRCGCLNRDRFVAKITVEIRVMTFFQRVDLRNSSLIGYERCVQKQRATT